MTWQFDVRVQRYRHAKTGRFLSSETVMELTKANMVSIGKLIKETNEKLRNDELTVGDWESQTRDLLKNLYIQSYLMGRGGTKNITQSDYGVLGARIALEYRFLRGVTRDIVLGRISPKMLGARMDRYVNRSHAYYELGKRESHKDAGYQFERRIRNAMESCLECITIAEAGWQAIGTLPGIGQECSCLGNCKCTFEYSRTQPQDSLTLLSRAGWIV